jgi:hypothetical protein
MSSYFDILKLPNPQILEQDEEESPMVKLPYLKIEEQLEEDLRKTLESQLSDNSS